METIRQFNAAILKKIKVAEDEGDIFTVNEIASNIMTGSMMIIMIIMTLLAWILNEVGLFTADSSSMREATIFSVLVSIPGQLLNKKYRGAKTWLKYVLCISLLLQVSALSVLLGHNVTLAMVIPVIISMRYFDEKFSTIVAGATTAIFLIDAILVAYIGIINLNVLHFAPGTIINIETTLREAVKTMQIDRSDYLKSYIINDYLPRFLIYSVIAIACCRIAKRSKEYLQLQDTVGRKSSRIETELNLAQNIQSGMLPNIFPAFPEFEELDIFAKNRTAKEVGGDFYDFFRVDADNIAIVIADVSGKGVGAALFMMIAKTIVKNQLQSGISPAEAITNANNQLCENNTAEMFVTMWAGVYNVKTGNLAYVNAGHNSPAISKGGKTYEFLTGRHGFVAGGMSGIKYRQNELILEKGDRIFLYTDGVTEATDIDNQLYGDDRLIECLNKTTDMKAKNVIGAVLEDVDKFTGENEQFDDITMLMLEID